jgi:hypothetical protein
MRDELHTHEHSSTHTTVYVTLSTLTSHSLIVTSLRLHGKKSDTGNQQPQYRLHTIIVPSTATSCSIRHIMSVHHSAAKHMSSYCNISARKQVRHNSNRSLRIQLITTNILHSVHFNFYTTVTVCTVKLTQQQAFYQQVNLALA